MAEFREEFQEMLLPSEIQIALAEFGVIGVADLSGTNYTSADFPESELVLVNSKLLRLDFSDDATSEQRAGAIAKVQAMDLEPVNQETTAEKIQKLESKLRNTAFWAHLWGAMISNVRANGCVSFLMIALTNTRNPDDLIFGFNQLRVAMQSEPGLTDFSPALLDFLSTTLTEINLELPGLNLTVSES